MVAYRSSGRHRRSVLVMLVVTSLLLITLDVRSGSGGPLGAVRNAARDALAPAQNAVADLTRPIGDWWHGTTSAGRIERENRALRRRVGRLEGEVAAGRAARTWTPSSSSGGAPTAATSATSSRSRSAPRGAPR